MIVFQLSLLRFFWGIKDNSERNYQNEQCAINDEAFASFRCPSE